MQFQSVTALSISNAYYNEKDIVYYQGEYKISQTVSSGHFVTIKQECKECHVCENDNTIIDTFSIKNNIMVISISFPSFYMAFIQIYTEKCWR